MITALIIGTLTGFLLCIPPGPISVTCIRYGLLGRTRDGTHIALGAATLDAACALVAVFTSSAIVSSLQSFLVENPGLVTGLQAGGVVVLAVLGIWYLKNIPTPGQHSAPATATPPILTWYRRSASHILIGMGIAFTSIIAPTFFPSLILITGFLHSKQIIPDGSGPSFMFGLGFGLGALLWLSALVHVVNLFRTRLSASFLKYVYRFAGGALIAFAAVLAYKVVVHLGVSAPVTRATQTLGQ